MSNETLKGLSFRKAHDCADKNCVEVGSGGGIVGVRDTKDDGSGPVLAFTPGAWAAFLDGARDGEFGLSR